MSEKELKKNGFLCLTIPEGQIATIGDNIEIAVSRGNNSKLFVLAIKAPREMKISRDASFKGKKEHGNQSETH